MNKTYIGIDVGSKGFITAHYPDGTWEFISILENDLYSLSDKLYDIKFRSKGALSCVIEDVHAVYGSSAKGTFDFGFNKGYLVGLLCALRIPYTMVQPKEWQSEMWMTSDKVYRYKNDGKKMVDTKNTSINACKRLFPTLDLKRTPACKNIDDNKVDSILMCEYARRRNL